MPVHPIRKRGRDGITRLFGFQWGGHGKIYSIRRYGKKGAFGMAAKQGVAIKISQLRR
jgi:hypothetical protein